MDDRSTQTGNCNCESPANETVLSRQRFLKLGIGALGALAALELGGGGLLYLQSRPASGKWGGVIRAGDVDDFPPGSVTEFPEGRFYLIRVTEGGFLAVYNRCPHLGCPVNWNAVTNKFICPCHASHFNYLGDFESAPVPRALDLFGVRIEAGQVLVDTAQLRRRTQFSPDQLTPA